jgi:hypothetical protein
VFALASVTMRKPGEWRIKTCAEIILRQGQRSPDRVRRRDVIGLHFFSPAHATRLLEIVRGAAGDRHSFAEDIGKMRCCRRNWPTAVRVGRPAANSNDPALAITISQATELAWI